LANQKHRGQPYTLEIRVIGQLVVHDREEPVNGPRVALTPRAYERGRRAAILPSHDLYAGAHLSWYS